MAANRAEGFGTGIRKPMTEVRPNSSRDERRSEADSGDVRDTESRADRKEEGRTPVKALADRQTDEVPETERTSQPVTAHQDRRHK
jgi:hypothetical protein